MFMFKVKRCCLVSNIQSILYWNYIYKLNKNHHLNLCRLKYAFFFISFVLRASSFFLFKLWPKHEKRNLYFIATPETEIWKRKVEVWEPSPDPGRLKADRRGHQNRFPTRSRPEIDHATSGLPVFQLRSVLCAFDRNILCY